MRTVYDDWDSNVERYNSRTSAMRSLPILALVAAAGAASAQQLSCPPSSNLSGRPCETYHYHVLMYRPETKAFAEAYGINQFASQSACDHAREAAMARNLAVVDYMKRVANDQQYQPDRFGTCHCDMTIEKSSPNFLTDLQRTSQIRLAAEIRDRVRERLMSENASTDSDVIRGLASVIPPNAFLGGPRLAPLPPPQVVATAANSADDLRTVKTAENFAAPNTSIDLPLVDISIEAPAAAAPAADAAPPKADTNAEDGADVFISFETERIQNVLKSSNAIADEALKSKVLESCMQRIQLLSNLRTLIQGSGARSRLAMAARSAHDETERLALVSKLFGSDLAAHWAPKDASEVVLPATLTDSDAEKVLRDSTGKFSDQQKKHALYALLAHSQPTEAQQLWLTTVVDTFLQ
jgi:hypothetical protein